MANILSARGLKTEKLRQKYYELTTIITASFSPYLFASSQCAKPTAKERVAHSLRIMRAESQHRKPARYTALISIRMHNFPLRLRGSHFIFVIGCSKWKFRTDAFSSSFIVATSSPFFQNHHPQIWGWMILTKGTLTKNGVHLHEALPAITSCYRRVEGVNWRKLHGCSVLLLCKVHNRLCLLIYVSGYITQHPVGTSPNTQIIPRLV